MDNRTYLKTLTQSFSPENLTAFLRAAGGSFRPESKDYSHYLEKNNFIKGLFKLGSIDFPDGRRLIALAGQVETELTSQSGKQKQYEIARKILKDEFFNAGIFVFHDQAGHFRFSLITAQYKGARREFSSFRRYTYFVSPDSASHTFVNQIGKADFASIEAIVDAFSVEPVTNEFFREYKRIFEEAESHLSKTLSAEQKRLYAQRFFNRLMFLAFLERKGWMNFGGRKDYLRALFADYSENETNKRAANFHRSRLNILFFQGLNNPRGNQLSKDPKYKIFQNLIGDVPYLNGGLFEEEPDDIDGPTFPDAVVGKILADLIYHFNFTVTESTPLDIEVAVDPEMLGKIFEELVTGRHESGSYYTPKPVVSFMCREALKGYLGTSLPAEKENALALFVDKNDPAKLRNPELALEALKAVKVCDPACGSGAYLLGMMHELLEQRECLFAAHVADAAKIYDRKLDIIQNNLYGVDLDPFAVNIARLRLWLSLIVDYEGETPPPLPNLDFKIESGDSLTAPDPSGGLQPDLFRQQQVKEFLSLKNEFMSIHAGSDEKKKLAKQIKDLREKIKEWAHVGRIANPTYNAFDWQVDFAEVFAPELAESTLSGKMAGIVNAVSGQMELTTAPKEGGFDIVLANPPYVRMELFKDIKPILKKIYSDVHDERADLYVYFYARAHQILRPGGIACFISSNKWLRAGYGEKLRQLLLDKQAFRMVVDFGELPVFQTAATFPAIFLWQKQERANIPTKWAVVKNLQECYDEGIYEHVTRIGEIIPSPQFGKGNARLATSSAADMRSRMELSGSRLKDFVHGQIMWGIKTGLNSAFILDEATYQRLVSISKKNSEILKPLVVGDNLRRYEIHNRDTYLIYTVHGIDITKYPAIKDFLKPFRQELESRATKQEWYELQQPQEAYATFFDKPKIIYPDIGKEPRFVLDNSSYYVEATAFVIPTSDWYLIGVLNSAPAFDYLKMYAAVLGDENKGGRLRFKTIYMETLPIPGAPQSERKAVAKLAEQAQSLHTQRRKRVEKFLREIGIEPAESTSRNPLEQPWSLTAEEFARRVGVKTSEFSKNSEVWKAAHDETMSVTEESVRAEREIDERVKSLYGL